MNETNKMKSGKSVISIAARPIIKERFDELYLESETNSKAEFLDLLLDQFSGIAEEEPRLEEDDIMEKQAGDEAPEVLEDIAANTTAAIAQEKALAADEILVKLNPVQKFALQKHLSNKKFLEIANKEAAELLNKRSFWSGELKYPQFFSLYPESGNEADNMGVLLINAYMTTLAGYLFAEEVNVEEVRAFGLRNSKEIEE